MQMLQCQQARAMNFKIYCLNDSIAGYCIRYFVYQGRDEAKGVENCYSVTYFKKLLNNAKFLFQGMYLFIETMVLFISNC